MAFTDSRVYFRQGDTVTCAQIGDDHSLTPIGQILLESSSSSVHITNDVLIEKTSSFQIGILCILGMLQLLDICHRWDFT